MKIKYALISCNSNMNYLGYWPVVAAAWRKLDITPVLFFIRDSDTVSPPPADGIVHTLEPLADVEMSAQYTCARFWGAQLYPDDVVATSDMDLMPLSKKYFIGQLQDIPDDGHVHLCILNMVSPARRVALLSDPNAEWVVQANDVCKFRAFCHIARGSLLKKILALPDDWEQAAREMALYNLDPMLDDDRSRTLSARWGCDEWYPTAKIHAWQDQSIFTVLVHKNAFLSLQGRLKSRGKRLDGWGVWDSTLLKQGYYSYMHVGRRCTPESLALMNYLLEDNQPPGKVQKWRAVEKNFLEHQEKLSAKMMYAAQLFLMSCFFRNRSPLDIACSRQMRSILKNALKAQLKSLLRRLS
ncbi:MAG: hypothetical protein OXU61_10355 [Gammaproteobacteria bacterium]|nr:hypothetical protein [Gammaproteobacteria bacterium]MDD9818515.1 hypothetical protein [Gammaproteobacteria bacterium]